MPMHACACIPACHMLKHTDAAFKSIMRVDDGWSSSLVGGTVPYDGASIHNQSWCVFVCSCVCFVLYLCCVCVVCLCHVCLFVWLCFAISNPLSLEYGPLACFGPTRTTASPPLFNNSAELRNFVLLVFLPYQTPYLAEYGPLACFGPTRTTASQPLFNNSAELRNFVLLVFFAISNPLSRRVRALLRGGPLIIQNSAAK